MLTLYNHNISVCVQKVRLAMCEKGLDWQDHDVDLLKGEQMSPEYLKIHPKGVVPALVHDGRAVIESTVILEYLDDAFPAPPLRPAAPHDRARMRLWARVPDDGLHAACGTVSFAAAFAPQVMEHHGAEAIAARLEKMPDRPRAARQRELFDRGIDAPFVADHARLYDKVLGDMEAALADGPWLAGDAYSLAECALLPYVWRLERLNLAAMWDERPRVADWFARCKARPSWEPAMERYAAVVRDRIAAGGADYDDDLRSRGIELWPRVRAILAA